jgi:hypothetical protein
VTRPYESDRATSTAPLDTREDVTRDADLTAVRDLLWGNPSDHPEVVA